MATTKDKVSIHNPAGRLLHLLFDLRTEGQMNPKLEGRVVWQKALSAPSDEIHIVAPLVVAASKLPGQIRAAFDEHWDGDRDSEPYIRFLSTLDPVFAIEGIWNTWGGRSSYINDQLLYSLEIGSLELDRVWPETRLPDDFLSNFQKSLAQLRADSIKADISTEMKEFIERMLHQLDGAVALYRIKGPEGMIESTNEVIGAVRNRAVRKAVVDEELPWYKTLIERVETLTLAADAAGKLHQLAANTAPAAQRVMELLAATGTA